MNVSSLVKSCHGIFTALENEKKLPAIRDYLSTGLLTKPQYPNEKITIFNLMAHSAGFQERFYMLEVADKAKTVHMGGHMDALRDR